VWSLGVGTDTSELGPEWLNAKIERHPQGNGWDAILRWNEAPRDFGGRGRSSGRGSGWGSGWSVSIGGRIRFALALVGIVALLAALVAHDVGSMVGVLHKVGGSSHGRQCTLGILDASSGAPFPIVEDLGVVVALGNIKARATAGVM
jgi:hypothetical protein